MSREGVSTNTPINNMKQTPVIQPIEVFAVYEIASSRWAKHVSNPWLQSVTGRYFAWVTRRKYARYIYRQRIGAAIHGMEQPVVMRHL